MWANLSSFFFPQNFCWLFSHRALNYIISHQNHIYFLNCLKIALSSRKVWLRSSYMALAGTHLSSTAFSMSPGKQSSVLVQKMNLGDRIMALVLSWCLLFLEGRGGHLQLLCCDCFEQICSVTRIVVEIGDIGEDIWQFIYIRCWV